MNQLFREFVIKTEKGIWKTSKIKNIPAVQGPYKGSKLLIDKTGSQPSSHRHEGYLFLCGSSNRAK